MSDAQLARPEFLMMRGKPLAFQKRSGTKAP